MGQPSTQRFETDNGVRRQANVSEMVITVAALTNSTKEGGVYRPAKPVLMRTAKNSKHKNHENN
jgi:hypothetical protein